MNTYTVASLPRVAEAAGTIFSSRWLVSPSELHYMRRQEVVFCYPYHVEIVLSGYVSVLSAGSTRGISLSLSAILEYSKGSIATLPSSDLRDHNQPPAGMSTRSDTWSWPLPEEPTFTIASFDALASRSPDGFRCNGSHAREVIHCLCAAIGCPSCLPVFGSHKRISPFLSPDANRRPARNAAKGQRSRRFSVSHRHDDGL